MLAQGTSSLELRSMAFMLMGVILSGWKGWNSTGDGIVMTGWGILLLASGGLLEARNAAYYFIMHRSGPHLSPQEPSAGTTLAKSRC